MIDYKSLKACARQLGEWNDCTVIAWSVSTGDDYMTAHRKLARMADRPRGGGPPWQNVLALYLYEGWDLTEATSWVRRKAKTIRTLARLNLPGTYIVATGSGRHIVAMRDGAVVDWTEGRTNRISAIWRVEPSPGVVGELRWEPSKWERQFACRVLDRLGYLNSNRIAA